MNSTRCCSKGRPFATISVSKEVDSVHITLYQSPCCKKEFVSFIELLNAVSRSTHNKAYSVVYDIRHCVFDRKYIKPQESLLKNANPCAIVVSNKIVSSLVKIYIKHVIHNMKTIQTFRTVKEATSWISGQ